jgi:hypothetical protein
VHINDHLGQPARLRRGELVNVEALIARQRQQVPVPD